MQRTPPRRTALPLLLLAAISGCYPPTRPTPVRKHDAEATARRAIANERLLDVTTLPQRSIGVAPLNISASDTLVAPLAYGLADLLMTDLARSAQLTVVERFSLDALLRELKLAEAGSVDATTAPRVGKLVGARRLVLGSITRLPGDELRIDAHIANVATTEVRQAISAETPLGEILDAEKALAFRLFDELGVILTPAERAAVEQRPTRNISALLAYSRGVREEVFGRYDAAGAEYRNAVQLDPGFSLAQRRLGELQPRGAEGGEGPRRREALSRAAGVAAEGINRTFTLGIGGVGDPSFEAAQTTTIIITITTIP